MRTGHEHTWFVLTQKIIEKEFALSGSEQNPDITDRDVRELVRTRVGSGAPAPVEAFKRHGADFVVERDLRALVDGMNRIAGRRRRSTSRRWRREVVARDRELANPYTKDLQVTAIHGARRYLADRITRVAAPHRLLDPDGRPADRRQAPHPHAQDARRPAHRPRRAACSAADGAPVPGLYAVGEAAGFGGGGMHGYRSLEGTFLGGCLFSGRVAGRALARAL